MSKKTAEIVEPAEVKEAPVKTEPNYEELVPVSLVYDGDLYKDDVFVGWNGRTFQIKRGETVMVPLGVKLILDNSMKQDAKTQHMLSGMQQKEE